MKSADVTIVNTIANRVVRVPFARARSRVLGFRRSKSISTNRLNAIAALRAPTMATRIHVSCHQRGNPPLASNAPIKANGNANTVCSNLIISNVIFNFRQINDHFSKADASVARELLSKVSATQWQ